MRWTAVSQPHTLMAWEEDRACHAGSHGGCTWEQSEQVEAVGSRLCSIKRMR